MNYDRYEQYVNGQLAYCKELLSTKHKEYAEHPDQNDSDHLSNFKRAGEIMGSNKYQAWLGMWVKHIESLITMINSNEPLKYTEEKWTEKITDAMNYLILLKCLVFEDLETLIPSIPVNLMEDSDALET